MCAVYEAEAPEQQLLNVLVGFGAVGSVGDDGE